ncbi:MAG: hypothetical protein ACOCRX_05640 [Candidatus Woesearchaeota archaeon]
MKKDQLTYVEMLGLEKYLEKYLDDLLDWSGNISYMCKWEKDGLNILEPLSIQENQELSKIAVDTAGEVILEIYDIKKDDKIIKKAGRL